MEERQTMSRSVTYQSRRAFLQRSMFAGGIVAAAGIDKLYAQSALPSLRGQIGLQLYTVRDVLDVDFEGGLSKVASIGYKEIEPFGRLHDMSPKQFRDLLDKYGLKVPSTHDSPLIGSDLERQFEGLQIMGTKYTTIPKPPQPRVRGVKLGAYGDRNAFLEASAFGPVQKPERLDEVKRKAAQLNAFGTIAAKFDIKISLHNHTGEFERIIDSDKTPYDIYLEETDPSLVTMELDIGWAVIAGKDPIEMFRKDPGRYELWHVKDVVGVKTVNQALSPNARTSSMAFVPVGTGQIEYKRYFEHAKLAGMRHFFVEQDNAAAFGDSLAAARMSYRNLARITD